MAREVNLRVNPNSFRPSNPAGVEVRECHIQVLMLFTAYIVIIHVNTLIARSILTPTPSSGGAPY